MNEIIAYCENENCGTVFSAGKAFQQSGNSRVGFHGAKLGPCPSCGGYGIIPDGYYQAVDDNIQYIKDKKDSVDVLTTIQELLYNFRENPTSKETVITEVEKISPGFASVIKSLPQKINFAEWLNVLIALLTLAVLVHQTYFKESPADNELRDKFIELLLEQNANLKKEVKPLQVKSKLGRNDKCNCGSGIKYKKCCLNK